MKFSVFMDNQGVNFYVIPLYSAYQKFFRGYIFMEGQVDP